MVQNRRDNISQSDLDTGRPLNIKYTLAKYKSANEEHFTMPTKNYVGHYDSSNSIVLVNIKFMFRNRQVHKI